MARCRWSNVLPVMKMQGDEDDLPGSPGLLFSQNQSLTSLTGGVMRTVLLAIVTFLVVHSAGRAQYKLLEDFEADTTLPAGWSVWNEAPFPIDPTSQWTVRDTAYPEFLPGLELGRAQAHSGSRAIGVSWVAGYDTSTGNYLQADAWLITRRITGIQGTEGLNAGDSLVFWATGGTGGYLDSLQVWISIGDSTPATQSFLLGSIIWPVGSTYGEFQRYAYDVSGAGGLDAWIGFRYNQDVNVDGFFVHIDDVSVGQAATSVRRTESDIPERFVLRQNYPNPFNPSTTIEFSLPQGAHTTLRVYNAIGQEVATLVDEMLAAGSYRTQLSSRDWSSGMYFYRLQSGSYGETRRLTLLK
jgi:Secretion system C-terminal sorting domain